MDKDLTTEDVQKIWNEEATKLESGSDTDDLASLSAPEDLPQGEVQAISDQDTDSVDESDTETVEAQAEDQEPEDPLAGMPQTVRDKLAQIDQLAQQNAQLLHHVKTAEGRVAAMQREFALARQASTQVAPKDAPTQGQMNAAAKSPEKWTQLKSDFPEWGEAMEEYVAAQLGSVRPQGQTLDPQAVAQFVHQTVAQTKAEMSRMVEEARLDGKYENWKEMVNTTDFAQWFAVQPADVRRLADSTSARDAIRMLDLFADARKRSATEIKQERGARLAVAATTRPGLTPPPKTLDDMSPGDLWNYEAAKREKEKARRGY